MLFRLRMSIDDTIKAYAKLARRVFLKKKWFFQEGTFKASSLENAVVAMIQGTTQQALPREIRMLDEGGPKWYVPHGAFLLAR